MVNKLKSCPFCDGQAELRETFGSRYYVTCKDCKILQQFYEDAKQAIEAWNRRVEDDRQSSTTD